MFFGQKWPKWIKGEVSRGFVGSDGRTKTHPAYNKGSRWSQQYLFVRVATGIAQTLKTAHIGAAHIALRVEGGLLVFWGRNFVFLPLWIWVQSFWVEMVLFWWGNPHHEMTISTKKRLHPHSQRQKHKITPSKNPHTPLQHVRTLY